MSNRKRLMRVDLMDHPSGSGLGGGVPRFHRTHRPLRHGWRALCPRPAGCFLHRFVAVRRTATEHGNPFDEVSLGLGYMLGP
jgi:hypothetical protein